MDILIEIYVFLSAISRNPIDMPWVQWQSDLAMRRSANQFTSRLPCVRCQQPMLYPTIKYDNIKFCQISFYIMLSIILHIDETIVRGCMSSSEGRCLTREHCLICDGAGCNLLAHTDPSIPDAPNSSNVFTSLVVLIVSMALAVAYVH